MNKRVWLPLLFGVGSAEPSISFFPGIISHLFPSNYSLHKEPGKALKQRSPNVVLARGGRLGYYGKAGMQQGLLFPLPVTGR